MADADDLDERAARLLARSQGLRESSARRRQAVEWAEQARGQVRGTASSADGTVLATVDQTGLLTGLEVSDQALRGRDGRSLAGMILSVVRQATAAARDQVRDIYGGLVDEGVLRAVPGDVLPAPEVPPEPASPARPPRRAPEPGQDEAPDRPLLTPASQAGPPAAPPEPEQPGPLLTPASQAPDPKPAAGRGDREPDEPPPSWLLRGG